MIGKIGSTEVDFVAEKKGAYTYFQVTADMTSKETFERELKPLTSIRDNYEKIVLTKDRFTIGNYNGIQVKYLPDWPLGRRQVEQRNPSIISPSGFKYEPDGYFSPNPLRGKISAIFLATASPPAHFEIFLR